MMKKYLLKPGKHQFAPGEHARHTNETLTDTEAEWYLKRYPHIKPLFIEPKEITAAPVNKRLTKSVRSSLKKSLKSTE